MPVLAPEPCLFPDSLFGGHDPVDSSGRRWYVMHTRPQQEKSLSRELLARQIPFYLPLICHRRRTRGRTVTSYLPLFSGYVSVLADREQRIAALSTRRIVRPLSVGDQAGFWTDLKQIEQLIRSGTPIVPEDRLTAGQNVTIRSGSLAGLSGTIVRSATGRRFVVRVDFIQRGASVLLDDVDLELRE